MAQNQQETRAAGAQQSPYWTPQFKDNAVWTPNDNDQVGEFSSAGLVSNSLIELAGTLRCTGTYLMDEIESIPDIWARPLFFQQMLYYTGQDAEFRQLRNDAIKQWRSLLCVAAMSSRYNLSGVDTVEVELPPVQQRTVISVLREMPPQHAQIWQDFNWSRIILVTAKDASNRTAPLIICHPATLVAPAADCWELLAEVVPFVTLGDRRGEYVVHDPAARLAGDDAVFMKTWLGWIRKQIADERRPILPEGSALDNRSRLTGLLEDFANDLHVEGHNIDSMPMIPIDRPIGRYTLFSKLDSMLDVASLASELMMDDQRILIDAPIESPSLSTQLLRSAYNAGAAGREDVINRLAMAGLRVLEKSGLFLDRMHYINTSKDCTPFIADNAKKTLQGHSNEDCILFLPIREEVCGLADSVEASVEYKSTNPSELAAIRFIWNITLKSGKRCTVDECYGRDRIVELDVKYQNTAAVWPNRQIEGWLRYFMYSNAGSSPMYNLAPLAENIIGEEAYPFKQKDEAVRYYCLNAFPKAVRCLDTQGYYIGMLPVRRMEPLRNAQAGALSASMDFGTSSSVIYTQLGANAGNPLSIAGSEAVLFGQTKSSQDYGVLQKYFIPCAQGEDIIVPFPTLYYSHTDRTDARLFLDGHLYFKKNVPFFANPEESNGRLLSNMKWGGNWHKVMYQMALMACLQARVNGYSRIKWFASYPISMRSSKEYLEDYKVACKDAMSDAGLLASAGIRFEGDTIRQFEDFKEMTESEAAARYFVAKDKLDNVNSSFLAVVDIGGGTSDIFVYRDDQRSAVAYESSIKLGARDLLLELLRKRPCFFARILQEVQAIRTGQMTEGISRDLLKKFYADRDSRDPYPFYQEAESIFSVEVTRRNFGGNSDGRVAIGSKLSDYVSRVTTDMGFGDRDKQGLNKEVLLFKTILAINIMPVFYYTGLILSYINEKHGKMDRMPTLCVAGNGSNMLKWLGLLSDVDGLIGKMLSTASDMSGDCTVKFSDRFKHEAAIGMTEPSINYNDAPIMAESLLLCGENVYYLDGNETKELTPLSKLSRDILAKALQISKNDPLSSFKTMLESFSRHVSFVDSHGQRRMDLYQFKFTQNRIADGLQIIDSTSTIEINEYWFYESVDRAMQAYQANYANAAKGEDDRPVFIIASNVLKEGLTRQWWLRARNDTMPWEE